MRLLIGAVLLAAVSALTWMLLPAPAAGCSCLSPVLISQLEPIDGSTESELCIISSLHATSIVPCEANTRFDDETFQRSP